jgi:hypothetical protein
MGLATRKVECLEMIKNIDALSNSIKLRNTLLIHLPRFRKLSLQVSALQDDVLYSTLSDPSSSPISITLAFPALHERRKLERISTILHLKQAHQETE